MALRAPGTRGEDADVAAVAELRALSFPEIGPEADLSARLALCTTAAGDRLPGMAAHHGPPLGGIASALGQRRLPPTGRKDSRSGYFGNTAGR
jgi:hypothetical protein